MAGENNLLDGYAKIEYGKDHHFYQELTISTSTYPTQCQVLVSGSLNFTETVINATSGVKIYYSFTGVKDAGYVEVSTPRALMRFSNLKHRKIWFRADSSSAVNVEVW